MRSSLVIAIVSPYRNFNNSTSNCGQSFGFVPINSSEYISVALTFRKANSYAPKLLPSIIFTFVEPLHNRNHNETFFKIKIKIEER